MTSEIYDYSRDLELSITLCLGRKSAPSSFLFSFLEKLELFGNKKKRYETHVSCILANLLLLIFDRKGEFVYYSRDNNFYKDILRYNPNRISVRKIKKVIELLIKYNFINHRNGNNNKYSRHLSYRSRFRPTLKFYQLLRRHPLQRKHICKALSDIIILKNNKKYKKDYIDNEYTNKIRGECSSYNLSLEHCKINLKRIKPVNFYLKTKDIDFKNKHYKRIFNGDFNKGGRFYGPWWLGIPSELRQYILINNNKTVEYDYSSLIIHQIYSEVGLNYFEENAYSEDPYLLDGVPDTERKINKAIIQIGLNCDDLDSLNKALLSQYKKGKLIGNKPKKKEIERRLNIFKEMNPKISDYVYSKCALRFQYQDSEIVRKIVNKCSRYLIPVLSVHDSFIVEETNSNFIIDTMNSAIKDTRLTSVPLIK